MRAWSCAARASAWSAWRAANENTAAATQKATSSSIAPENDHRHGSPDERGHQADDGEHPDGAAPGDGEPAGGARDAEGNQNEQERGHVPEDQEGEGDDDRDSRGQRKPGRQPS